jgi:RNA polymerase sigma factor (sigma-70 family)
LYAQGDRGNRLEGQQPVCDPEKTVDLRQSIERLSVDFREVLIMRELEQMSYREIADVTGLTVATVISRLSMARKGIEFAMYVNYRSTPGG